MTPEERAHALTDDALEELEGRISAEYARAEKELTEKLQSYLRQLEARDEAMKARLDAGSITQDYYIKWRTNQIAIGERWETLRNQLASDMSAINENAAATMRDGAKDVYALNHNYAAYQIENDTGMNLNFQLYDKDAVDRLLEASPNLLPQPRIDIPADLRWNKQLLTSELTQSILQGESISKMADRMQNVTDMNRVSAIRNARTAITGAENGAREQAAYSVKDKLSKYGFTLKKEWMATLDARTRDSHAKADGQRVDIDKPFDVGGAKLMYPGDPSGPAREIYNCRCSRQDIVGGFDEVEPAYRRDQISGQLISDMSYKEWAGAKNGIATGRESRTRSGRSM